jgi:hypothetical protein
MTKKELNSLLKILNHHMVYFESIDESAAYSYFKYMIIAVEMDFAGVQAFPNIACKSRYRSLRGELKFLLTSTEKPITILDKLYHPASIVRSLMENYNFWSDEVKQHTLFKKRKIAIQKILKP